LLVLIGTLYDIINIIVNYIKNDNSSHESNLEEEFNAINYPVRQGNIIVSTKSIFNRNILLLYCREKNSNKTTREFFSI
jgi:hypothetical protein